MYWLGYLNEPKEASDLDWEAIGGTWGSATSRLSEWRPRGYLSASSAFADVIDRISSDSQLLANYVHRYFEDMHEHFRSITRTLSRESEVHYIVGNSKFYETIVPTESLFAELLDMNGFSNIECRQIRKRSSKKELYEYVVSAEYGV